MITERDCEMCAHNTKRQKVTICIKKNTFISLFEALFFIQRLSTARFHSFALLFAQVYNYLMFIDMIFLYKFITFITRV